MRLFENAHYNFIGNRRIGYILSGTLVTVCLLGIVIRGLQYGIDFSGGAELLVSFQKPVSITEIKNLLTETLGSEPQVRQYGSPLELQIRTSADRDVDKLNSLIQQLFDRAYPDNPGEIKKSDVIGPVFAQDIRNSAFNATIFSILVISMYILWRFKEASFMTAVVITLIHDTIIIVGLLTVLNGVLPFNVDIDQSLVAALMTIIGYSLNDTIVVFDRVRENRLIHRSIPWPELVNTSVNQTLSRTVVTSLTTLFVVVVLFFFGGATLKGFSFTLIVGIVLGTYSTIFLSCPFVVDFPMKKTARQKPKRTFGLPSQGRATRKAR